ncbi:sigma intracellular receptor 2-like [Physella acuta]|uniref:sigma intracellular receptor 2-like n=1 Tax=Physella acuta TaxID=109671 RepID=UPI0027DC3D7C|nr:sigma intracellular receptor 2-like [Physella acuta]
MEMAPPGSDHRKIDYLFFGYFFMQIPSTILFDSQGLLPEYFYPGFLRSLRQHYLESYRDPFLANPWGHPWYLSICLLEHSIELPFFFWAAYCYYYGAMKKPAVVLPSILYGVHTVTAVLAIWCTALAADFSAYADPAPRSPVERLKLCSAYAPFFFIPLCNIYDSCTLALKEKQS